eukprot:1498763-Pleurochrysis_carterae.AAC.1
MIRQTCRSAVVRRFDAFRPGNHLCVALGSSSFSSKRKKEEPSEKYRRLSPVEHVLLRPGMYVGSAKAQSDYMWVFDAKQQRMVWREVSPQTSFMQPVQASRTTIFATALSGLTFMAATARCSLSYPVWPRPNHNRRGLSTLLFLSSLAQSLASQSRWTPERLQRLQSRKETRAVMVAMRTDTRGGFCDGHVQRPEDSQATAMQDADVQRYAG